MSTPRHHWLPSTAVATLLGALCGGLVFAVLFGFGERAWAAIDFNAALFEDFLGPYWQTAERIAGRAPAMDVGTSTPAEIESGVLPAPGYLYPATFACALAPFTSLGAGAASALAAVLMAASVIAILSSAFVLRGPSSWPWAALLGASVFLAQPVVHGIYWAQASLPALALVAVGFAAASKRRPVLAGVCIALAASIKLFPALFLVAFVVRRDVRGLMAACLTLLVVGVVIPTVMLGPSGYVEFHAEVAARLDAMSRWVATPEGGRGSQDLAALAARWIGEGAAPIARVIAFLLATVLLVRAIPRLRDGAWLDALPLIAAIPWLTVGPTWPHALAWLPLAWWSAATSERVLVRSLAAASFLVGSVFALAAIQPPATFAWYGLPACSAALATLACALDAPHEST